MCKANFLHKIKSYEGHNVLAIEDLNIGGMSVTNDIENVVSDIAVMEKIDPSNHLIVYKDTDGTWDGWDHEKKRFIVLYEDTWNDAASKYIQLHINNITASA